MSDLRPGGAALDAQVALQQSQLRKLAPPSAKVNDPEAARVAAQDFEAVFLAQMIGHMWTDLPTDGKFTGGFAEQIWRKHLHDAMGKELAAAGGVGLAEQIQAQMLSAAGMPPEEALRIAAEHARGGVAQKARADAEAVDNSAGVAIAAANAPVRVHPAQLDAEAAAAALNAAAAYGAASRLNRGE